MRARWHFEELSRGQWQLVVDRLPPATSSRDVLDRIEQITNPKIARGKKTLSAAQIHDKELDVALLDRVRDESGRTSRCAWSLSPSPRASTVRNS